YRFYIRRINNHNPARYGVRMRQIYRYLARHAYKGQVFLRHETDAPYFGIAVGAYPHRGVEAFFITQEGIEHVFDRSVDILDAGGVLHHVVEGINHHTADEEPGAQVTYQRDNPDYQQEAQSAGQGRYQGIYAIEH